MSEKLDHAHIFKLVLSQIYFTESRTKTPQIQLCHLLKQQKVNLYKLWAFLGHR